MSPIIVTYTGIFVAACILMWAGFEVGRRLYRQKKVDKQAMNAWVPLQSSPSAISSDAKDKDKTALTHPSTRAQQNGHYSESKKLS